MLDVNFLKNNGVDVDKSLELFGTIDVYNDTVGEFLMSAPEKISKLEAYKNSKDMANYAIYVHSLKSDARYFGLNALADLAYDQEMKSKAGDAFYISSHFQELATEASKAINIIRQYLDPNAVAPAPQPVAPQPVAQPAPAAPAAPAQDSNAEYDKSTILVIDDSNIVRNFVKRIFSENYNVGIAKDGEEAINIIERNKDNGLIEAILLDLNMPKVDGFAVLEYMQNNNLLGVMPVSIISGDSSKETIDKAYTYKIVDMLGKPFNESDVKRIVEKTMSFKEVS